MGCGELTKPVGKGGGRSKQAGNDDLGRCGEVLAAAVLERKRARVRGRGRSKGTPVRRN